MVSPGFVTFITLYLVGKNGESGALVKSEWEMGCILRFYAVKKIIID